LASGNDFASKLGGAGGEASSRLAKQFLEVSKLVQLDTADFETERSMFYTTVGGRYTTIFF
jgi:hypothetical protein